MDQNSSVISLSGYLPALFHPGLVPNTNSAFALGGAEALPLFFRCGISFLPANRPRNHGVER